MPDSNRQYVFMLILLVYCKKGCQNCLEGGFKKAVVQEKEPINFSKKTL